MATLATSNLNRERDTAVTLTSIFRPPAQAKYQLTGDQNVTDQVSANPHLIDA